MNAEIILGGAESVGNSHHMEISCMVICNPDTKYLHPHP